MIPTWVLPDSMLLPQHEDPSRAGDKMRPDVMFEELTREEQHIYSHATCDAILPLLPTNIGHSCKRRKVWILEVGHSSDTKYEEKLQEEILQHQALVNVLTTWGYDVQLRPLPLGFAGTIYKSNLKALIDLGITGHQSLSILRKLHIHAITCLHSTIRERRYLKGF